MASERMGHNGKDESMVRESEIDASQCANAMIEIKIKTLDSQTYTLRVDKCVSVPALKEQVASVTGIVTEQQRLICRGRVLKDDQLLSAYDVEDGHTLHLVVRQPIAPLSESSISNAAADPALSAGDSQDMQQSLGVGGFFIIASEEDISGLGQIVSPLLGSLGISNTDIARTVAAMGLLHERVSRSSAPHTMMLRLGQTTIPISCQQVSSGERSSTGLDGVHQNVVESSRQPQSPNTSRREGDSSSAPVRRDLSELRNRRVHQPSSQVAGATEVEPASGSDEDEAAGRGSNSGRQASSSRRRHNKPVLPPESKRQKRK